MDDMWDLHAIVQSCKFLPSSVEPRPMTTSVKTLPIIATTENVSSESALAYLNSLTFKGENNPFSYPVMQPNVFQELEQVMNPFTPTNTTATATVPTGYGIHPSSSFLGQNQQGQCHMPMPLLPTSYPSMPCHYFMPVASPPALQTFHHQPKPQKMMNASSFPNKPPHQAARLRRRKIQQKKLVCRVAAEDVSSDMWAWRKYGQKPIKGSNFPRNYYRCSSSKGCTARKHVERSSTEPNKYVVTYAGDHSHPLPTHRNPLSGSTWNKPTVVPNPDGYELPTEPPLTVSPENEAGAFEDPISINEIDPVLDVDLGSDDEDILVPNMAAMDDDLILNMTDCGGAKTSNHAGGSFPSQPA